VPAAAQQRRIAEPAGLVEPGPLVDWRLNRPRAAGVGVECEVARRDGRERDPAGDLAERQVAELLAEDGHMRVGVPLAAGAIDPEFVGRYWSSVSDGRGSSITATHSKRQVRPTSLP
jgi:hypothetical protein